MYIYIIRIVINTSKQVQITDETAIYIVLIASGKVEI